MVAAPREARCRMSCLAIASFLPAATEMIYLLGLEDQLVGRSHECDYPARAATKPVLVDCALDLSGLTSAEIDAAVTRQLSDAKSLYRVDEARLLAAAPDLIVTQNLCQVCGPAGNEVAQVLRTLHKPPKILWQTPRRFEEMFEALRALGHETGKLDEANAWIRQAIDRIERIARVAARLPRVRVAFLEWVDPLYCGGHWIPQMLDWAGAEDSNSRDGSDSVRIPWESVLAAQPEVIIVSPCGFETPKALRLAAALRERPGWQEIPAVVAGRVFAVDANAYFARPGPRLVDAVELLAHLVHPEHFAWDGPTQAYERVSPQPRSLTVPSAIC